MPEAPDQAAVPEQRGAPARLGMLEPPGKQVLPGKREKLAAQGSPETRERLERPGLRALLGPPELRERLELLELKVLRGQRGRPGLRA